MDFTNSVKKHRSTMLVHALSFYQVITHSFQKWSYCSYPIKKKHMVSALKQPLFDIYQILQLAYPKFLFNENY